MTLDFTTFDVIVIGSGNGTATVNQLVWLTSTLGKPLTAGEIAAALNEGATVTCGKCGKDATKCDTMATLVAEATYNLFSKAKKPRRA